MPKEPAPSHGVMPTIGTPSCWQAELLWRCRYWKRRFGTSSSTQAIKPSSSPITDHHKGKTRWSLCTLQSEVCGSASVLLFLSPCSTLTNRQTISTRYSKFWMLIQTDTPWTTRTYFPDIWFLANSCPISALSGRWLSISRILSFPT